MKKIYLVRHAQSLSNAGGNAMPNADIPLTELGKQQAKEASDWIIQRTGGAIDSIKVSKYLRTQLTAEPLIKVTGIQADIVEGLHEFNYLAFKNIDGLSVEERLTLAGQYWQQAEPAYIDGGDNEQAESFTTFEERTSDVLDYLQSLQEGTHIVYSHGLWISMLIWKILAQPVDTNNAMQKFRQFELAIRARNCEVFLLVLEENKPPSITKVRTRTDTHYNAI